MTVHANYRYQTATYARENTFIYNFVITSKNINDDGFNSLTSPFELCSTLTLTTVLIYRTYSGLRIWHSCSNLKLNFPWEKIFPYHTESWCVGKSNTLGRSSRLDFLTGCYSLHFTIITQSYSHKETTNYTRWNPTISLKRVWKGTLTPAGFCLWVL